MASNRNGTLYTGVTSSLVHRAWQHREGLIEGFHQAIRMQASGLVRNSYNDAEAIAREKQIKGGSRTKKMALIEAANPGWRDLFSEIAHSSGLWIASSLRSSQ